MKKNKRIHTHILMCIMLVCNWIYSSKTLAVSEFLEIPRGGHFEIQTTQGLLKTQELKGQTLFLFFGFGRCPHVCPTTLRNLKRMLNSLPIEERKQATILFISVDKNESQEELKEKMQELGVQFYASVPGPKQLKSIMPLFGATYRDYTQPGSDEVVIDHTSSVFVINGKGIWVNTLKFDSSAEQFKEAFESAPMMSPVYAEHRLNRMAQIVAINEDCDLSLKDCKLEESGSTFKVSLSPRPILPEKTYNIKVTQISGPLLPVEADFEGIEQNMGFIRPKLSKKKNNIFHGNFTLPFCELKKMKWKLNLITKDGAGKNYSFIYYFSTNRDRP